MRLPRPLFLASVLLLSLAAAPHAGDPPPPTVVTPETNGLLAAATWRWSHPDALAATTDQLRAGNPEWDFMSRTFTAWSLANLALAEPARRAELLPVLDHILADTLAADADLGPFWYLLPYGASERFRVLPARSAFVDGEIALMIGLRRLVEEREDLRAPMAERLAAVAARMEQSPALCAESYPDECWIFCTTVALAAMRVGDVLDGTDHRPLFQRWGEVARARLVDPRTGLLFSSFHLDGTPKDGPEGSSIYLAAHMLQIVDPTFAADQYRRADHELGGSLLGFGYAREWPDSWPGPADVDAGDIVPGLGASPSASAFALLGAVAFGDTPRRDSLARALAVGAGPVWEDGRLRYAEGNAVGDAVLLYAGTIGPAWARIGAP